MVVILARSAPSGHQVHLKAPQLLCHVRDMSVPRPLRSRAAYRVATTRGATGVAAPQARAAAEQEVAPPPPAAVLSFAVSGAAFSEGAKEASLVVERSGEELARVSSSGLAGQC